MRYLPNEPNLRLAALEQWARQDEIDISRLWQRIQDVGGIPWPGNPLDIGLILGNGGLVTVVRTLSASGSGLGESVLAVPQIPAGGGFTDDSDAAQVTLKLDLGAGYYLPGLLPVSVRRDDTGIFADPLISGIWFVRATADESVVQDSYSTATLFSPLDAYQVDYQATAGDVTGGDAIYLAWDIYQGMFVTIGGGGASCPAQNEIQRIIPFGSITGGSFIVYPNGMAVTLDWDSTDSDATTAFEGVLGSGNAEVTGGPWPDAPLDVEFKGSLANTNIPAMSFNKSGLVGTGAGLIVQTIQQGRA